MDLVRRLVEQEEPAEDQRGRGQEHGADWRRDGSLGWCGECTTHNLGHGEKLGEGRGRTVSHDFDRGYSCVKEGERLSAVEHRRGAPKHLRIAVLVVSDIQGPERSKSRDETHPSRVGVRHQACM